MNRVLKDYARGHKAAKRGGANRGVPIDSPGVEGELAIPPEATATVLSLSAALERLAQKHPRQTRVAKLRFLAGCTEDEIGEILGLSVEQIRRDWRFAKAWLKAELG